MADGASAERSHSCAITGLNKTVRVSSVLGHHLESMALTLAHNITSV